MDSKKKIASGDYDSAVTVLQHKGYFFTSQNLALFDQSRVRWPATQTVEPIIEINNAGFLGHLDILRKTGDRLGNSPYFFPSSKTSSMDIDWEDDFLAASALHKVLK